MQQAEMQQAEVQQVDEGAWMSTEAQVSNETQVSNEMVPDLSDLSITVRTLMHANRELGNRVARQAGRNATDTTALGLLDMHGPMSPVDLAHHLGIRTASATVLIDRLEQAGDVTRVRHETDRRRVVVHLTEQTRARERAVWTPIVTDMEQAARKLTPTEQDVVRAYLTDLVAVYDKHPTTTHP